MLIDIYPTARRHSPRQSLISLFCFIGMGSVWTDGMEILDMIWTRDMGFLDGVQCKEINRVFASTLKVNTPSLPILGLHVMRQNLKDSNKEDDSNVPNRRVRGKSPATRQQGAMFRRVYPYDSADIN